MESKGGSNEDGTLDGRKRSQIRTQKGQTDRQEGVLRPN